MRRILSDIRLATRLLLKTPGFAAIAILALALGIGANTAIFSAIDRVLIRPLPYGDADRLAFVWEDATHVGFPRNNPAPRNFYDWKEQNKVFADMAATRFRSANLTGDTAPELVFGRGVTANLFSVLQVKPLLGRAMTAEEEKSQASVVLISYSLWQRRFSGDRNLIGRKILMDGLSHEVIGVMPPGFHFPDRQVDFWGPINFSPQQAATRGSHFLTVVARLKPGVTFERAQTDMQAIARRLQDAYPETNARVGSVVVPAREQAVGEQRDSLWVLLAASGFVLLIACANIANLLLARAASREREMAIRSALGARRGHLIRQLLTESLLLSVIGGAAGLLLGQWGLQVMDKFIPASLGGSEHLSIDARVLAFTAAISILTGVVFGMAPALQSTAVSLNNALKEGTRGNAAAGSKFRSVLVVAEVALAMILLVGAGLMMQTLANLRQLTLGFNPDQVMTMRTVLPFQKYRENPQRVAFYESVLAKVKTLPGVESAGFASNLPFTAVGNTNGYLIEGRPEPPHGIAQDALYREVTLEYLQTMKARLREGRFFDNSDRAGSLPVVIINQFFAKLHWQGESAIGKRIRITRGDESWLTVVGVIEDMRERGIGPEMKPAVYLPIQQATQPTVSFLAVRTTVPPTTLTSAIREAIWAVDRQQPVFAARSMNEILDGEVSDQSQQVTLLGGFAALALLLAVIGIYGVLSYAVAMRTREIGVRVALGATGSNVAGLVLRQGMLLTLTGVGLGLIGSVAATRAMESMLFGIAATDPGTYAAVALVLTLTAMLACWLPAMRAARVDPIVSLREE